MENEKESFCKEKKAYELKKEDLELDVIIVDIQKKMIKENFEKIEDEKRDFRIEILKPIERLNRVTNYLYYKKALKKYNKHGKEQNLKYNKYTNKNKDTEEENSNSDIYGDMFLKYSSNVNKSNKDTSKDVINKTIERDYMEKQRKQMELLSQKINKDIIKLISDKANVKLNEEENEKDKNMIKKFKEDLTKDRTKLESDILELKKEKEKHDIEKNIIYMDKQKIITDKENINIQNKNMEAERNNLMVEKKNLAIYKQSLESNTYKLRRYETYIGYLRIRTHNDRNELDLRIKALEKKMEQFEFEKKLLCISKKNLDNVKSTFSDNNKKFYEQKCLFELEQKKVENEKNNLINEKKQICMDRSY